MNFLLAELERSADLLSLAGLLSSPGRTLASLSRMDGVGEDFSGLPESRAARRTTRREARFEERRSDPYRGRRTRILVVIGFGLTLFLVALALVVMFAPTPYLGTSHGALANSVGGSSARDCRPAGGSWICVTEEGDSVARYRVSVDWAGCWSGDLVGARKPAGAETSISGCVSIFDHLTAD